MDQLTRTDLASMSYADISQARRDGRLNAILGRQVSVNDTPDMAEAEASQADDSADPAADAGQLTREDLAGMSPDAIVNARAEGRLNRLLGRA